MKKCSRCAIEKNTDEFYKKSKSKDGLESHCKACELVRKEKYKNENLDHVRKINRESAERNKEKRHIYQREKYYQDLNKSRQRSRDKYYKNRDEILEKNREKNKTEEMREKNRKRAAKWRKEKKEIYNLFCRVYRHNNKLKIRAVQKVNDSIRYGKIIKPNKCSTCGKEDLKLQAHHDDYNLPMDVIWLCKDCHCKIHGKLL